MLIIYMSLTNGYALFAFIWQVKNIDLLLEIKSIFEFKWKEKKKDDHLFKEDTFYFVLLIELWITLSNKMVISHYNKTNNFIIIIINLCLIVRG